MNIDYFVTPTFSQIHRDRNPFIFVMGPVRPLSGDTEILTPEGWIFIKDWTAGTQVAQYNVLDKELSFYTPNTLHVQDADEFIHFKNANSLSMKLSPEHNVITRDYAGKHKMLTAEELEAKPSKHLIPTTFVVKGEAGVLTESVLRLRTAIAADGHYPKVGNQCTFSLRKPRKKERLRSLLTDCGIEWTEVKHKSRPTETIFTFSRPTFEKHFGNEIFKYSSAELKTIVDESSKWDGTETKGTCRFTTSLKDQADKIQFAAHASGYRASINKVEYNDKVWKPTYVVEICKSATKSKVFVRCDTTTIERVPSEDGKKYCLGADTGFFLARHDNKIFITGNSGKSSGCVFHCFLNACRQKPDEHGVRHSKYLIVRDTYPAIKSTILVTWISWFKDKIKITYDTPIKAEIKYGLDDGTTIHMELVLIGVSSAQEVEKLRSLEVTGCHINEAASIDKEVFEMIKTRVGHFPAEKDGGAVDPFILADYNAVDTEHWLYKLAEETRPEGHSFYRQPPAVLLVDGKYVVNPEAENITRTLPDGSVIKGIDPERYMMMCMGSDPDFIYVNIMNNYGDVRHGRPVFKDYNDSEHCSTKMLKASKGAQLIIGMDQGLTPAAVFTQQLPDGSVQILREITTKDCSLQEFCQDYLWPTIKLEFPEFEKNFHVICDPATVQRSMNDSKAGTDVIRECGIPFRTAKTNNFIARKEAVTHFLRLSHKFTLDSRCKMLRKGFLSEYKFEEIRAAQSGNFKETPAKNEYSHVHDALQYAMLEYYHEGKKKRPVVRRNRYKVASGVGGY